MATHFQMSAHPPTPPSHPPPPTHIDNILTPATEFQPDGITLTRLDLTFTQVLRQLGITNIRHIMTPDHKRTMDSKGLRRRFNLRTLNASIANAISSLYAVICVGIIHTENSHITRRGVPSMAHWDGDIQYRTLKPEYKDILPAPEADRALITSYDAVVTLRPEDLMRTATVEHENRVREQLAREAAKAQPTRTQPTRTQPTRIMPTRACTRPALMEPIQFRTLPRRTKIRRRKPTARRGKSTSTGDSEYWAHDKLIGPPIRPVQSDPTKDLILASREGNKLHILEATVPAQIRAAHYAFLIEQDNRQPLPPPTTIWEPTGPNVALRDANTIKNVRIHKEENNPDEDINNLQERARICISQDADDTDRPLLAKCYDKTGHHIGTITALKIRDLWKRYHAAEAAGIHAELGNVGTFEDEILLLLQRYPISGTTDGDKRSHLRNHWTTPDQFMGAIHAGFSTTTEC